ncbi:hypothetical protein [Salmonirosea aquatica]|uniref:Uncharacterized protein n=1 Tax=Salmonirosea aquatica TaxID=2654236 RepID=A0A7C9BD07_9BACT|nr:hypothetical protein [Cytophagaceae bacterium SJW1-29]
MTLLTLKVEAEDEIAKRTSYSAIANYKTDWFLLDKKTGLTILISVLLSSCTNTVDSGYPYLRFDKNDTKTFINYQKGRILVFNSSTAPSRTYQVQDVVQQKSEYTVGMGFFGGYASKYYEYDERLITFKNLDGKINEWVINYQKRPSVLSASGKPDLSSPAKLSSKMKMWEWNEIGPVYPIDLNDKTELVTLQIGNQQVRNVQKISSGRLTGNKTNVSYRFDWDVNVLYFSAELGIIGFGDINGNVWLLEK